MIKLLIGGSPCTYWSIAQKNNRETEPSEIKTAEDARCYTLGVIANIEGERK